MKRILRAAALCGLALAAAGGSAQAQIARKPTDVNSIALKVGFYNPGGGEARRSGGKQVLLAEADYVVQNLSDSNLTSVVSLGYMERDGLRIVPLTINELYHDERRTSAYDFYYGYGFGLYSVRLNDTDTSGETKNLFGGVLTAGYNINDKTFVEAKYHYISKYDGKSVRGFALTFGVRL